MEGLTAPAAAAQAADCSLTLSPTAQVSVAFLISLAALEELNRPDLVLACTQHSMNGVFWANVLIN